MVICKYSFTQQLDTIVSTLLEILLTQQGNQVIYNAVGSLFQPLLRFYSNVFQVEKIPIPLEGFQPFFRFYAGAGRHRDLHRRQDVSTLLEILPRFQRLGAMWDAVERAFQPFLRFYALRRLYEDPSSFTVSALLEILRWACSAMRPTSTAARFNPS